MRTMLVTLALAGAIALAAILPGCGGSDNAPIPVVTGPTGPTGFGEPGGLTTTKDNGNSHP